MKFSNADYILVLEGGTKATDFELELVFLGAMDLKASSPFMMFAEELGGESTCLTAFDEDFAFLR